MRNTQSELDTALKHLANCVREMTITRINSKNPEFFMTAAEVMAREYLEDLRQSLLQGGDPMPPLPPVPDDPEAAF